MPMDTIRIDLTDEELMHVRVALLLRLARLTAAIDTLGDAPHSDAERSRDAVIALLDGKLNRRQ